MFLTFFKTLLIISWISMLISDVHMPDKDGFKLLEHVGLEMDLPVIMMSADGMTSAVMRGVKHEACDYLIKHVRLEELKNVWQHVIRKRNFFTTLLIISWISMLIGDAHMLDMDGFKLFEHVGLEMDLPVIKKGGVEVEILNNQLAWRKMIDINELVMMLNILHLLMKEPMAAEKFRRRGKILKKKKMKENWKKMTFLRLRNHL
ncbi:hypothetical protein IFM89_028693 [Coptis chinensis]|uniref:Response regulatory domain-containing protein n=1 Tax=Coptis chinensis TaxID=261450 RepID=A0A835I6E1_9MAGN|nr:hypothetical protein IFM89_028693 [Coptis chinensis]